MSLRHPQDPAAATTTTTTTTALTTTRSPTGTLPSPPPSRPGDVNVNAVVNVDDVECHDWLSLIPSLLERHQLQCTEQTIESARALLDAGILGSFTNPKAIAAPTNTTTNATFLSSQLEESLLESFLEDDYDGTLHLITLSLSNNKNKNDDQHNNNGRPLSQEELPTIVVVGIVFWRELSPEEMNQWIHWEHLQERLIQERRTNHQQQQHQQQLGDKINHHEEKVETSSSSSSSSFIEEEDPRQQQQQQQQEEVVAARPPLLRMRRSLQNVRKESIRWLELASSSSSLSSSPHPFNTQEEKDTLTHGWMKLELLAVHPDYFQRGLGTILMICAMYQAYHHNTTTTTTRTSRKQQQQQQQQGGTNNSTSTSNHQHIILHVAGGQDNIPAIRLYEKFGFVSIPQEEEKTATIFHKPNRNICVLGNVEQSLQRLCWSELLLPPTNQTNLKKI